MKKPTMLVAMLISAGGCHLVAGLDDIQKVDGAAGAPAASSTGGAGGAVQGVGGADGELDADQCAATEWIDMAPAPGPLHGHATVFAGDAMFVWGGVDSLGLTNVGYVYDVNDDQWWALPATTLTPRRNHSMVWTGEEVVVWGGHIDLAGTTATNTGRRLALPPQALQWSATSTPPELVGRGGHVAAWGNTQMLVWGGSGGGALLEGGSQFDPATGNWADLPIAPGDPINSCGVWTGDELLVWGTSANGQVHGYKYDGSWVEMSTVGAPSPRVSHKCVWTGSELVVWGGVHAPRLGLDSGGRYDPASDTWSEIAVEDAPDPRREHALAWVSDCEAMVVWGGDLAGEPPIDGPGGLYNPSTDTWCTMPEENAPVPREGRYSVVVHGKDVIIWGGNGESGSLATGKRFRACQ